MRRASAVIAMAGMLAISNAAIGCGACVEDKVAVTYDHAVVHAAIQAHRQVVFVALDGRDAALVGARIVAAAATVKNVRGDSVRYATSPTAFSFALAKGASPDKAIAAFRTAVAGRDVRMTMIRLMREGALVDPPG
jgi:hypothetical protein